MKNAWQVFISLSKSALNTKELQIDLSTTAKSFFFWYSVVYNMLFVYLFIFLYIILFYPRHSSQSFQMFTHNLSCDYLKRGFSIFNSTSPLHHLTTSPLHHGITTPQISTPTPVLCSRQMSYCRASYLSAVFLSKNLCGVRGFGMYKLLTSITMQNQNNKISLRCAAIVVRQRTDACLISVANCCI